MLFKALYQVDLVEVENQHFYTIDNDPTFLPGVTGILDCISKPALVPWSARETALYMERQIRKFWGKREPNWELMVKRAKRQPRFIKEKAAASGSNAHKIFDWIIGNARMTPANTQADNSFMPSFDHWMKTEKLLIVKGDTKIASKLYGYGGSLDTLLIDDRKRLWIGDFKTGNSLYDTHALQIAAYSQAFQETYGLDYRPAGVVFRFERGKPKYERREVRDIDDSFRAFKAALDLCRAMKLVQFCNRETIKPMKKKEKVPNETTC